MREGLKNHGVWATGQGYSRPVRGMTGFSI